MTAYSTRFKWNCWSALLLLMVICAACGKKTRTMHVFDELPSTLNPLFATTEADARVQELVYERVFYQKRNALEIQSDMVRYFSHRAYRNNTSTPAALVLKLRDDRRWPNGQSISAEDLCFTVNALLHPENPVAWAGSHRETLAGCAIEGENAVVQFKRRVLRPREWLMIPLLPAHRFDTLVVPLDHPAAHLAYGIRNTKARKFADHVVVDVVKKKDYPDIKRVEIRQMGDPDQTLEKLEFGQAQGIISLPPAFWEWAETDITLNMVNFSEEAWWFIALNTQHGPMREPIVRRALDRLIDRTVLLSKVDRGTLCAAFETDRLPPACMGDDKVTPVTALISGPFVRSSPLYNDEIPVPAANQTEGVQLLTDLGWENKTTWVKDGDPILLRVGIGRDHHAIQPQLLSALQTILLSAGFQVETTIVDGGWPGRDDSIASQFDLFIGRWQSWGPGRQIHGLIGQGGTQNLFDHQDTTLENLFGQAQSTALGQDAHGWAYSVHAHLAEDRPLLFLWSTELRSVWRREFRGTLRPSPFYYYTDYPTWGWLRP